MPRKERGGFEAAASVYTSQSSHPMKNLSAAERGIGVLGGKAPRVGNLRRNRATVSLNCAGAAAVSREGEHPT